MHDTDLLILSHTWYSAMCACGVMWKGVASPYTLYGMESVILLSQPAAKGVRQLHSLTDALILLLSFKLEKPRIQKT